MVDRGHNGGFFLAENKLSVTLHTRNDMTGNMFLQYLRNLVLTQIWQLPEVAGTEPSERNRKLVREKPLSGHE